MAVWSGQGTVNNASKSGDAGFEYQKNPSMWSGWGGAFKPRTCVFGGVVEIRLLSLRLHTMQLNIFSPEAKNYNTA